MTDNIWRFWSELSAPDKTPEDYIGGRFLSEYDPHRYIDEELLTPIDLWTGSNITERDEPLAVAASSDERLTIEVYERKAGDFTEVPARFLGILDDYLLHVDYVPGEDADAVENGNSLFLSGRYFGFDEKAVGQVEDYLNAFSDEEYATHISGSNL